MSILRGLKVTASGTMLSRVLGMARDMATAYRFGASSVMDALVLALRIPDLFRRMFGEGVLGASLIPSLNPLLADRPRAWKFITAALLTTSLIPLSVVLAGELLCGWRIWSSSVSAPTHTTLGWQLTALLLPYVILVCMLAQLAAALHAMHRFTAPSLVSCVLNLGWIAACLVAPWWSTDQAAQARLVVLAVVGSGIVQVAWLAGDLAGQGWRLHWPNGEAWSAARRSLAVMLPAGLSISATQMNTTLDGLSAWWLSQLGKLPTGAASAVYFGERMFMLPVGVVGVATAVVLYPTLCQMASESREEEIAEQVHRALRGLWLLAAPASVGLAILAPAAVAILLERGEFRAEDSRRAAQVAAAYGLGIGAFSILPLLARVELALRRPWRAAGGGIAAVLANAILIVGFGSRWGEAGFALSTSACAALQLLWLLSSVRQVIPLSLRAMAPCVLRVSLAAAAMGCAIYPWRAQWLKCGNLSLPGLSDSPWFETPWAAAATLVAVIALGAAVHLSVERVLRILLPDPPSPHGVGTRGPR